MNAAVGHIEQHIVLDWNAEKKKKQIVPNQIGILNSNNRCLFRFVYKLKSTGVDHMDTENHWQPQKCCR